MEEFKRLIQKETQKRSIRISKWITNPIEYQHVYEACYETRTIRIPLPIDEYHFIVCLHEIGHLVKGDRKYSYLAEYHAERWAIERAKKYGVVSAEYEASAKEYILRHIITNTISSDLRVNKIRKEVLAYLNMTEAEVVATVRANAAKTVINTLKIGYAGLN